MLAFFRRLSPSERRLAVVAGVLLAAAVLVVGTLRAVDSLAAMDETIASLQQDLLYYKQQTVQADAVEKAYQAIAAQHSSQWTQEEIHDRLRREITRLTLKNLPKPGQDAPAAQANSALIDIRSMPGGTLEDSNEGYRRYTINFHTEPARAQNLAQFLERLQQSDQVLRVDSLDITRQAATSVVTAMVKVTRTVIGDATTTLPAAVPAPAAEETPTEKPPTTTPPPTPPPTPTPAQETGNLVRNPSFESWDAESSTAAEWTADGCTLAQSQQNVTEGQNSLRITAGKDGATFYQSHSLVAGSTYEVALDMQAEGPATVTVADGDGEPLGAGQAAKADGGVYKYRFTLTVPGTPGDSVPIRAPFVVVTTKLGVVTVDNATLVKKEGKP